MSDNPNTYSDYEDMPDNENPFYGLDGFDGFTENDPYKEIEQDVLDTFGIESFDEIVMNIDEAQVENIRGNRFQDLREAVLYLFDAGILRFSGVVVDDDLEVAVEIEPESP